MSLTTNVTAAPILIAGLLSMALSGMAAAEERSPEGAAVPSQAAREGRAPAPVQIAQGRGQGGGNHIFGRAKVIDGDTLEIRGRRIRIHGIDAFQARQRCRTAKGRGYPCGRRAASALARRVEGHRLACVRLGRGRNATLATCWSGAEDVGAWMVLSGWAVATGGPNGAYAIHERVAQRTKAGAWSGRFDRPSEWRRSQRDDRRPRPRGRRRERDD